MEQDVSFNAPEEIESLTVELEKASKLLIDEHERKYDDFIKFAVFQLKSLKSVDVSESIIDEICERGIDYEALLQKLQHRGSTPFLESLISLLECNRDLIKERSSEYQPTSRTEQFIEHLRNTKSLIDLKKFDYKRFREYIRNGLMERELGPLIRMSSINPEVPQQIRNILVDILNGESNIVRSEKKKIYKRKSGQKKK